MKTYPEKQVYNNILLFLSTGFFFLGRWINKWFYLCAILLLVIGIIGLKRDSIRSFGFLSVVSFSGYLLTYNIKSNDMMIIVSLLMILMFFVSLPLIWKLGWKHLTFFLLPGAVLWTQMEIFEGMSHQEIIMGSLFIFVVFVIGGSLASLLKKDKNILLIFASTVIISNVFTSFLDCRRVSYGTFWANFLPLAGCTVVFGLILIATPKMIHIFNIRK